MKNKANWLYIVLGSIIGFGTIMGANRMFSKDEEAPKELMIIKGTDLEEGTDLTGYKIRLTGGDEEFNSWLDSEQSILESNYDEEAGGFGGAYLYFHFTVEYPSGYICDANELRIIFNLDGFSSEKLKCYSGDNPICYPMCTEGYEVFYISDSGEVGVNENFVFDPTYKWTFDSVDIGVQFVPDFSEEFLKRIEFYK